jgi:predicted PurR-regulated permease PerM
MDIKPPNRVSLEEGGFLVLVLLVTLAFFWLVLPYFGAVLWGLVAAILFEPVYRRLNDRLGGRRGLAATLTLLLILVIVIAPAIVLGISLIEEASRFYDQLVKGDDNFVDIFSQLRSALPPWMGDMLARAGLGDFEAAVDLVTSSLTSGLERIASHALLFGQGALKFLAALGVMLYLTFFLLRDGKELGSRVRSAIPLKPALRDRLVAHFVVVVRATMKGSVVVAILQGIVGGVIFWFLGIEGALLWGLLMALFSLVPAVGTGMIWVPVAIYLFITGRTFEGTVLTGCGLFIIGLIDNLVRPYLVGHDTRMPDFVVLIATLAGIELMGLNGFIVGPMIAALFIAVWTIVTENREEAQA